MLYAHTDKMGVVNNARYLEYFEAGRNDLLRNVGSPYAELEKLNVGLPVIEAYAKFIQPARYDELIVIRTEVRNIPTVRFRIDYLVSGTAGLLVTGFTVHAFIDLQKLTPVRPPVSFIELLRKNF